MKAAIALVVSAFLVTGLALAQTVSVSPSSATGRNGTVSPTSTWLYKMAVIEGQVEALGVLEGKPASDVFAEAKAAAEHLIGRTFESDLEAATVIVDLAESIREYTRSA